MEATGRQRWIVLAAATVCLAVSVTAQHAVKIDTEQADIVLAILDHAAAGRPVEEGEWSTLFASEPYVRLKRREAAMKRDFTDDEFRAFVLSPALVARRAALRATLESWRSVDIEEPVRKAMAYLPPTATIRATVYPVIKPMANSFVFEVDTDPAIFLYLDPEVTPARLSNTLAHELHHIGFGGHCPTAAAARDIDALPDRVAWVVGRLGAFGEGFAMLAAAGGPDVHPHESSDAADRARWDADVARVAEDMATVARFLEGALDGSLTDDERNATFRSFYGVQGPWYTVGWVMAATIERELGRQAVIDAFCDPRVLLARYNEAAAKAKRARRDVPTWPADLVERLRGVGSPHR